MARKKNKMKRLFYLMCLFLCLFTIKAYAVAPDGVQHFQMEIIEERAYPDVPLDRELLEYIDKNCSDFGIDFYIFLALIDVETGGTYDPKLVSDTNDYGLCQINKKYMRYHCEQVGMNPDTFDAFNPIDSIDLSIRLLHDLRQRYIRKYPGKDLTKMVLGAYNRGKVGMESRSTIETEYATAIINKAEALK